MNYQGYSAKIQLDEENGLFHGEVLGIADVVTFQGTTVKQLTKAFKDSVDDYLAFCEERGEEPNKPYSGKLMLRTAPELHRMAASAAEAEDVSLNVWITQCIEQCLQGDQQTPIS